MRALVVVLAVVASAAVSAASASAEWFVDVYGGRTLTENHDVSFKGRQPGGPVNGRLLDVAFRDSWMYGGRLGRWFDTVSFLGLAVDVSQFYPNIEAKTVRAGGTLVGPVLGVPAGASFAQPVRIRGTEIDVTGVSFDLMLRLPLLTSANFPKGRLQPYVTAGPGLYITTVEFNTDVTYGAKGAAGLLWQLTRDIAVFGEYRFTHVRLDMESSPNLRMKSTLDSEHLIAGVSVRFW